MSHVDKINLLPQSLLRTDPDTTQAKLWTIFADELDSLEVDMALARLLLSIDDMEGVNLDQLGTLLRETRKGKDDDTYKTFLKVAIKRVISRGDIYSINDMAAAVGFDNILIIEGQETLRLDGTWLLDGTKQLNGIDRPATFTFSQQQNVDDSVPTFEIGVIINSARAAGVKAIIAFAFISNESQGYVYVTNTGVLDGTWLLNGTTALNPDKVDYTPNKIALGDGGEPAGVREPEPSDTGLQNELIRKDVEVEYEDGIKQFAITLEENELAGDTINEIGIFRDSQPIIMDAFVGRAKDAVTKMIFKIKETD